MSELNPNHEVTQAVREQWHKIAALLILKFDLGRVVITEADLVKFGNIPGGANIVIKDQKDGIHIWLVSDEEGARLAKEEGGLPV